MSRSVQQNLITQSPDGTVSASFPGGLDMLTGDAGDPSNPTAPIPSKSIRWHRSTTNGPTAAYIAVGDDVTQDTMNIVVNSSRDRLLSSAYIQANDPSPVNDAWLGVSVGGGLAVVSANAASQQKIIIDKSGKSGFVKSGFNSNNLTLFTLEIAANGIINFCNDPLGSGFISTSKFAVGQYVITFPNCIFPIFSFIAESPANGIVCTFRNTTQVNIGCHLNGTFIDAAFSGFLALAN